MKKSVVLILNCTWTVRLANISKLVLVASVTAWLPLANCRHSSSVKGMPIVEQRVINPEVKSMKPVVTYDVLNDLLFRNIFVTVLFRSVMNSLKESNRYKKTLDHM